MTDKEQALFSDDGMDEADLYKMMYDKKKWAPYKKKKKKKGGMNKNTANNQTMKDGANTNIANKNTLAGSERKKTDYDKKQNLNVTVEYGPNKSGGGINNSEKNSQVDEDEFAQPQIIPQIEIDAYNTLQELKENFPQTEMNGSNNVWIVKPAGLSRGRGIKLFGSLPEINQQIRNKEVQWVIQKYIENPALIGNRKFDIRQWVMVCDWNPQTIWFYEECYIHFSGHEFSLDNQKDRYAHLTNNSVNKMADDYKELDMFWEMSELIQYLIDEKGYDYYNEVIKPRMKDIVKYSQMSVQGMIENRSNSSEIYGYDFCLDENWNIWLIEINSSPAFDFSSVIYFC